MVKSKLHLALIALALVACAGEEPPPPLAAPDLLAPADGATLTQNPPHLIWSTVNEEQIVYRVEVADDPAFGDTSICAAAMVVPPDTQYLADSALAPGTYYWHVCTRQDC